MKNIIYILFLSNTLTLFSQDSSLKKFETSATNLEVITDGLDNIVLENTDSNFIEIILIEEQPVAYNIILNEKEGLLKIRFTIEEIPQDDVVFRKFITKRLHRASVLIKIPKKKSILFTGENIDIESKSYQGNLDIFIEKGDLKLHTLQGNTTIQLFAGNISAKVSDTNIKIVSNLGKIKVNDLLYAKKYHNKALQALKTFDLNTIKANILLTTK